MTGDKAKRLGEGGGGQGGEEKGIGGWKGEGLVCVEHGGKWVDWMREN